MFYHLIIKMQFMSKLKINMSMIKRILNIAVLNRIENGSFTLGRVLVTSIIALFGTSQITNAAVSGINLGIVTAGANNYVQAQKA